MASLKRFFEANGGRACGAAELVAFKRVCTEEEYTAYVAAADAALVAKQLSLGHIMNGEQYASCMCHRLSHLKRNTYFNCDQLCRKADGTPAIIRLAVDDSFAGSIEFNWYTQWLASFRNYWASDDGVLLPKRKYGGELMARWKFFLLVAGVTLLFSIAYVDMVAATTEPAIYKTFRLNPTDVAVTCKNGNSPVTKTIDTKLVIVSCSN